MNSQPALITFIMSPAGMLTMWAMDISMAGLVIFHGCRVMAARLSRRTRKAGRP